MFAIYIRTGFGYTVSSTGPRDTLNWINYLLPTRD